VKTDWIKKEELGHLLAALTPPNRLAMEIALHTGLRISDVLSIRTDQLLDKDGRLTVRQFKTGKNRRVRLTKDLTRRCLSMAGKIYVFEHRLDWKRHRTRQAVWSDIKRIARMMRIKANIAPHSARKVYAVDLLAKKGLERVERDLGHSSASVTMLYAMADVMTARRS
jgi:integrase